MRINIKGTNIELTDDLRSYIIDKFGVLERLFPDLPADGITVEIEIGKPSQHHRKGQVFRCGAVANIEGSVLSADEMRETPQEAIDIVKDEIEQQAKKLKAKQRDRFLRSARKAARGMKVFWWLRRKK